MNKYLLIDLFLVIRQTNWDMMKQDFDDPQNLLSETYLRNILIGIYILG